MKTVSYIYICIVPSNTAHYYFVQWYVFQLKLIVIRHSVQNFKKQGKVLLFLRSHKYYKMCVTIKL